MKTKISILLLSSILIVSCSSNDTAEQTNNWTQEIPSSSLIQEDNSRKATVSPDAGNEATETPEIIDTATWETATNTDFINTWSATLTQTWN